LVLFFPIFIIFSMDDNEGMPACIDSSCAPGDSSSSSSSNCVVSVCGGGGGEEAAIIVEGSSGGGGGRNDIIDIDETAPLLPAAGAVANPASQQRKRKRLNAVLDKISHHLTVRSRSHVFDCQDDLEQDEDGANGNKFGPAVISDGGGGGGSRDGERGRETLKCNSIFAAAAASQSSLTAAAADMFTSSSFSSLVRDEDGNVVTDTVEEAAEEEAAAVSLATSSSFEVRTEQNRSGGRRDVDMRYACEGGVSGSELAEVSSVRKMSSSAALRREQWRDTQQQSVEEQAVTQRNYLQAMGKTGSSNSSASSEVFKFDSFDRDRYLTGNASVSAAASAASAAPPAANKEGGGGGGDFSLTIHTVSESSLQGSSFSVGDTSVTLGNVASNISAAAEKIYNPAAAAAPPPRPLLGGGSSSSCDAEILFSSPVSGGRSPHSSLSSPQISVDSPRICFSPLRIKDSIEEAEEDGDQHRRRLLQVSASEREVISATAAAVAAAAAVLAARSSTSYSSMSTLQLPKLSVRGCDETEDSAAAATPASWFESNLRHHVHHHHHQPNSLAPIPQTSLSRPISPNPSISTPISPSTPIHSLKHLPVYLTDIYRRRCLSDTDLSASWEDLTKSKSGSVLPCTTAAAAAAGTSSAASMSFTSASHAATMASAATAAAGGGFTRTKEPIVARSPAAFSVTSSRYLPLPTTKGGSLESEASGSSSHTQDSPLDLSVRSGGGGICSGALGLTAGVSMDSVISAAAAASVVLGAAASSSSSAPGVGGNGNGRARGKSLNRTSGRALSRGASGGGGGGSGIGGSMDRFSLDRLDHVIPVVENAAGSSSNDAVAYVCQICGQMFGKQAAHVTIFFGVDITIFVRSSS
jgi:hypothetical protein